MIHSTNITGFSFDLGVLPRHSKVLLDLLTTHTWTPTADLIYEAQMRGYTAMRTCASDNLRILQDAGLVERAISNRTIQFRLTDLGSRLRQEHASRPALYTDLIHYLYFSLHEEQRRRQEKISGWSWIYQATCRLLWETRPTVPTFPDQAALLGQHVLVEYPNYTKGIHRKSPNAVQLWLRELDPPFLSTEKKPWSSYGRSWCSPELLVMGISLLYRRSSVPYGTPLLLNEQVLRELSILCLVESPQLEDVLEVSLATFPFLNIHSGEWGRSVILAQEIRIPDIL